MWNSNRTLNSRRTTLYSNKPRTQHSHVVGSVIDRVFEESEPHQQLDGRITAETLGPQIGDLFRDGWAAVRFRYAVCILPFASCSVHVDGTLPVFGFKHVILGLVQIAFRLQFLHSEQKLDPQST